MVVGKLGETEFETLDTQQPGIIAGLLQRSYADLLAAEPAIWGGLAADFAKYDRECFANSTTVGRCVLVATVDGEPVGFASWDPRGRAEGRAIIGHNCVVPEWRGRGLGRAQVGEVLRRLAEEGFGVVEVSTSEHPFFAAAQRMYRACGFVEAGRAAGGPDERYGVVHYARKLTC